MTGCETCGDHYDPASDNHCPVCHQGAEGGSVSEDTLRYTTKGERMNDDYYCDRGKCAAQRGHDGTCLEASGWNEGDHLTAANTDRELYREGGGDGNGMSYYDPSVHVTDGGAIGMNVGGHVITTSIRGWHEMATGRDALVRQAKAEAMRSQADFFRAVDMDAAADHCEQAALAWEAPPSRIADLIERSSLGAEDAKRLRASVSDAQARRLVERAEELRRTCRGCGEPLDEHPDGPPCPPPPPPGRPHG